MRSRLRLCHEVSRWQGLQLNLMALARHSEGTVSVDDTSRDGLHRVDNQADLDALAESVNWDDAEPVAFVGDTLESHAFFPSDVARSGYLNWNVRVLLYVADGRGSHLEIVLIDCDETGAGIFEGLTLRGRVDSLKRVEVWDSAGQRQLRCSQLMYRFLDVDQTRARRFYGFGEIPEDVAG